MPKITYKLDRAEAGLGYSRILIIDDKAGIDRIAKLLPQTYEYTTIKRETLQKEFKEEGDAAINILVNKKIEESRQAGTHPGHSIYEILEDLAKHANQFTLDPHFMRNFQEGFHFKVNIANNTVGLFGLQVGEDYKTFAQTIKELNQNDDMLMYLDNFAEFEDCDKVEATIKKFITPKAVNQPAVALPKIAPQAQNRNPHLALNNIKAPAKKIAATINKQAAAENPKAIPQAQNRNLLLAPNNAAEPAKKMPAANDVKQAIANPLKAAPLALAQNHYILLAANEDKEDKIATEMAETVYRILFDSSPTNNIKQIAKHFKNFASKDLIKQLNDNDKLTSPMHQLAAKSARETRKTLTSVLGAILRGSNGLYKNDTEFLENIAEATVRLLCLSPQHFQELPSELNQKKKEDILKLIHAIKAVEIKIPQLLRTHEIHQAYFK